MRTDDDIRELDNRDPAEMLKFQEARIEALQRRVKELEKLVAHYEAIETGRVAEVR